MSTKVRTSVQPPVPVREGHDIAESQLLAFLQFLILAVEAYPANCWAPAWQQVKHFEPCSNPHPQNARCCVYGLKKDVRPPS